MSKVIIKAGEYRLCVISFNVSSRSDEIKVIVDDGVVEGGEFATDVDELKKAGIEYGDNCIVMKQEQWQRYSNVIDHLLAHCPNAECQECAQIVCPHGHPLHFHHDGCPACAMEED